MGFPGAEVVLVTDSVANQGVSAAQGAPTPLTLSTYHSSSNAGVLCLGAVDPLGQMNLHCGGCLCIVGGLGASHWLACSTPTPSCDGQKSLQTLQASPGEQHCSWLRVTAVTPPWE